MNAVSVRIDAGLATLTLDQADSKVNVLSRSVLTELGNSLSELASQTGIRGLIVRSAKPGIFIAGADLKELAAAPSPDHPPTREYIEQGLRVLDQLETLAFPVVACVDGAALGGGLEVALACDYRLAGTNPKTKFGLPEITLGLIPGWGGTQRLPRLIGPTSAIEMILNNLQLNAEAARFRGLATKVVPSEILEIEARALLEESRNSGDWQQQRSRKLRPLDIDPSGATIDAMSSGTMTEAKMNAMSLSPDALQAFRETIPPGPARTAALKVLEVIERGCRLPLKDALKLEIEAFAKLCGSTESRQLIGAFFSARKK